MNRATKIKIIQAIYDGKLNPAIFKNPKSYTFIELDDRPGFFYERDSGKVYDEKQVNEICSRFDKIPELLKTKLNIGIVVIFSKSGTGQGKNIVDFSKP